MGRNKNKSRKEPTTTISPTSPSSSNEIDHQKENQVEKGQRSSIPAPSLVPTKETLLITPDLTTRVQARQIYIHTLCHTCKADGQGSPLLRCGSCHMVSYCSRDHQALDWGKHKKICRLIKKTILRESRKSLYEGTGQYSCVEEGSKWLEIRHGYLTLFVKHLQRELEGYEKEMLLFPPLCFSCGTDTSNAQLTPCSKCHAVSFCPNHKDQTHTYCPQLKLWVELTRFESENGLIRPEFNPKATMTIMPYGDITSFVEQFSLGDDILMAGVTDIATVPLTILWALKWLPPLSKESLELHLLGGEMEFEGNCQRKWETFLLHLLPEHVKVQRLKIVLVGPELLPSSSTNQNPSLIICSVCKENKRGIRIEHVPGLLYHEYVLRPDYVSPDIICAFNCGIYRTTGFNGRDTWAPTLPLLAKGQVIITTSYTEIEGKEDYARIMSHCPKLNPVVIASLNSFQSLRPQRTLVNERCEPLMYKNQFINVFTINSTN